MKLLYFMGCIFFAANSFAAPVVLQVESQSIMVNGKSVTINTIKQPNGQWGYIGQQGDKFDVIVKNKLAESTAIHWHGLILPNNQDGVSGLTQPFAIAPESEIHYQFPLVQSGTYWMHSHYGLQAQSGVEAPLIIENQDDVNYQQVVVMFQDFSFKTPEQIMSQLQPANQGCNSAHTMMGAMANTESNCKPVAEHSDHENDDSMDDMDMSEMDHGAMDMGSMDLNDVKYDAYLTNFHSPDQAQIITVVPDKPIKLRFINGAMASNFWINLGKLKGTLIAVDGQEVKPLQGSKFELAMAQRADIIVTLPKNTSVPILGQVEGLTAQTGLILTTGSKLKLTKLSSNSHEVAPALNYSEELKLHSTAKLATATDKTQIKMNLTGDMKSYQWQINGQMWPNIQPLKVKQGQLVTMVIDNQSMMAHPIHLHGYTFKIVKINGKSIDGAMRDTVLVLPHSQVEVQFVADQLGKWMLHCHTLYHMEGGMMTYLEVDKS